MALADLLALLPMQAIGTGVILAAEMRVQASWQCVQPCLQSMVTSNKIAGVHTHTAWQ